LLRNPGAPLSWTRSHRWPWATAQCFSSARAALTKQCAAAQQSLDLDPSFVNALWWQGVSYAGKRRFSASMAWLNKALAMSHGPTFVLVSTHKKPWRGAYFVLLHGFYVLCKPVE